MSLKKQAVSGLLWTFGQQFSVQIINFIVQIILARILLPEDFGLIAMLSVFIAVGVSLTDSGLTSSLIRTPNVDQGDYSTVFFMNLIGSIAIYLLLFITSPLIADFYNQPILIDIIRIYTLTFIIRAFAQVQQTKLTKEMNFKLQMMIQIPSVLVSGICGIAMAYQGYGVWTLVWMNLIQTGIVSIQLWIRTKWVPSFIFDWSKLKYHFNFGYKLTLSGLLSTVFNNIYNLVIGKYFSPTVLGYYNRADTLRMFPIQNISTALNKVTYPMFASIQDDNVKLKTAYKKLMTQVMYWLAPLIVLLVILAVPLFRFVLTEKWLPAVPYFQLLCVGGLLYPLHAYNLNILNVKGRSDLFLRLEIIKKIFITIGIVCVIPFGIYGLLYFQVFSSFISFYINTYYSGRMINYTIWEQMKDISPMLLLSISIGFVIFSSLKYLYMLNSLPDPLFIVIVSLAFMVLYLAFSYLLRIPALFDFKKLILKR